MRFPNFAWVGLMICLSVVPGYAATFCVATTGSNSNSCAQATLVTNCAAVATPKLTVSGASGAAECASAGDTVEVAAGTYTDALITSSHSLASGSSGNRITLQGVNRDTVIFRPAIGGGNHVISFNNAITFWTLKDFTIDGRNLASPTASAFGLEFGTAATDHIVQNVLVKDVANNGSTTECGIGIFNTGSRNSFLDVEVSDTHTNFGDHRGSHCFYGGGGDDTLIQGGRYHDCGAIGIQFNKGSGTIALTGTRIERTEVYNFGRSSTGVCVGKQGIAINTNMAGALLVNNIVRGGTQGPGITIYGTRNSDTRVCNNTVYGNAGIGITVGTFTDADNTILCNNILAQNAGGGIRIYTAASGTTVTKNLIFNSGVAIVNDDPVDNPPAGITGTITSDPLLVNPGAADFHLQASSPAIDAGDSMAAFFTDDFYGTTRTGTNDLGAITVEATVSPLHLEFATSPPSGTVVAALFDVSALIKDAAGTLQDLDSGNCTLSKVAGPGTLAGCTLVVTPTDGVCAWTGCTLDAAGSYTLRAARASTTDGDTAPFTVVTAPVASSGGVYMRIR